MWVLVEKEVGFLVQHSTGPRLFLFRTDYLISETTKLYLIQDTFLA